MIEFCLLWLNLLADLLSLVVLGFRSKSSLAAENLFLRKQLGFYQKRKIRPRRTSHPAQATLILLSRWLNWRSALTVVTPRTFVGWQRKRSQLFWRNQCQAGRPRIPPDLQRLIRKMARDNPSWGQARIANELLVKLGLRVSPRTIRKYLPESPGAPGGNRRRDQRWSTFLKNHAAAIIACDFLVVASANFRILYVLVVMEHASRRIIHLNVTPHPSAAWTLQQLREAIPSDHTYRFILHDHDAIFSTRLDASVNRMGLKVIKTPVRSPQANSLCERLIGTLRRECLDWIIPVSEEHLRKTLRSWLPHYNRGRPHSSLGPGLPDPVLNLPVRLQRQRHCFDRASRVVAHPLLNGLHHEYNLLDRAA
ncbi:MAG: integrase core domain-containing protein [Candidatus Binataceae bacterium]